MSKFMKKNSKNLGFTLVELLVVITIIGIIAVLAFPSVRQLQSRNRNKKFEKYAETVESAGKLYTDSYSADMFGMRDNGCIDILYTELHSKSLIKDYEIDGVSCDNENTFAQVTKKAGKYYYKTSLYCTKDGKEAYSNVIQKCDSSDASYGTPKITVTYKNIGGNGEWSKSKEITLKASGAAGLIDNVSVNYGFSTDPNVKPTNMETLYFKNKYGDTTSTVNFTDNSLKNGKYYLFVDGDNIIDIEGSFASDVWSTEMKFDNTAPGVAISGNLTKIYGAPFNLYEGVSFTDNISSSDKITKKVYLGTKEISKYSDLRLGENTVTYEGTDEGGNTVTGTRKITLVVADTTFGYKESEQVYTIEATGTYIIEAYAAQGGNSGGKGGYVKAEVYLNSGDKLYIMTGGVNGFNGGGQKSGCYPGGGATTIKYNGKVIVTAGGGGAQGAGGTGGAGGSSNGAGGSSVGSGAGANGSSGGGGTNSPNSSTQCGCNREESRCVEWSPTFKCCCGGGYKNGKWYCADRPMGCTCGGACTRSDKWCASPKNCPVNGNSGSGGASSVASPATKVTQTNGSRAGNGSVKISYKV